MQVEYPSGSGDKLTLPQIADDISDRLIKLFLKDDHGDRPMWGGKMRPDWTDLLVFPEYFNGDTGEGLGAMHQAGWTALVLDLILARGHSRQGTHIQGF